MNRNSLNISALPSKLLPILSDEEAGEKYSKWSYVNIYSLKNLKDVYLVCVSVDNKTVKEIANKVNKLITSNEKWEERKVLEYLNALVKFGLLNSQYNPTGEYFICSQINEELKDADIDILKGIFFTYFRFKELSSWFISPELSFHENFIGLKESDYINNSKPLYFYSDLNRFTDTFFVDIDNAISKYIIQNDILMRFWDVYLKWGTTLNILDKFNISNIGKKNLLNKEISGAYFIKPFARFDLIDFIERNFNSRHILIPDLILKIIQENRYSVNEIKAFIVSEILNNAKLTYERTSEIFLIKGKTSKKNTEAATYLYPKISNSYISHLILRK